MFYVINILNIFTGPGVIRSPISYCRHLYEGHEQEEIQSL